MIDKCLGDYQFTIDPPRQDFSKFHLETVFLENGCSTDIYSLQILSMTNELGEKTTYLVELTPENLRKLANELEQKLQVFNETAKKTRNNHE